jgi:hypothetical protein
MRARTALEVAYRVEPLLLVLVAVHRNDVHALHQQELVDRVHVALVLRKHEHRRRRLLQAGQQVGQLVLLLDVLHLLDHVKVGSTCKHEETEREVM